MTSDYYIVHNPLTFNLMDLYGKCSSSLDVLEHLSNEELSSLNPSNYLKYLKFDLSKQRKGMVESFGIESYAMHYIANQIAKIKQNSMVLLSDGKRRSLDKIIEEKGKPKAVFFTTMSSNFPIAIAMAIPLNYAKIPVIIGGIHVSTSPKDVDIFLRDHIPNPELVSQVRGAGDLKTLSQVVKDLDDECLQPEYIGYETIEDGVWGSKNIVPMEPVKLDFLKKIPIVGNALREKTRTNTITPYLGCPYSCSFCSISTLPKKERKFRSRSSEDFINELRTFQKSEADVNFTNRFFFFSPDNLLLGGRMLDELLDKIINSDLKINYAAQVSIEVANDERLLGKLRASGATHFLIGLESLDIRNLEIISKNSVKDIKKNKLGVKEYYTRQIRKIQNYGISIHGAFILGLPFDYFNSLDDHTGLEIAQFCRENSIGLQSCSYTDLPGSINFKESQEKVNYIYGAQGTIDYFISLSLADMTETNRIPPETLKQSPLVVFYMVYDSAQRASSDTTAFINSFYMAKKSWQYPTKNGASSLKERFYDSVSSFGVQLMVSQNKDHAETAAYSNSRMRGVIDRLYEMEKDPEIKSMFKSFVESVNNRQH